MASPATDPALPAPVADVLATAVGTAHRHDPVTPRTGGPAGNARLTAWLGLLLLVAFAIEGATLLSLHQLLTVHLFVGAILVPLALLKTATTGWRILRYYTGDAHYRAAGPPPMLLRLLGPLVILTALAVLGTGLALVAVGSDAGRQPSVTVAGQSLSPLTMHKLSFVLWFAATALHVLARTLPAVQLAAGRVGRRLRVPGGSARLVTTLATLAVGVVAGVLVVHYGSWHSGFSGFDGRFDHRH